MFKGVEKVNMAGNRFGRLLTYIICIVTCMVLLIGCNYETEQNVLAVKYLELLEQKELESKYNNDYDNLTDQEFEIISKRGWKNIGEIFFDKKGNLWYSSHIDGLRKIYMFDLNGNEYEYCNIYTQAGGEEAWESYSEYVNGQANYEKEEEIKKVFDGFELIEKDLTRMQKLLSKRSN